MSSFAEKARQALSDQRAFFGDALYEVIDTPQALEYAPASNETGRAREPEPAEYKPKQETILPKAPTGQKKAAVINEAFVKAKTLEELDGMINTCLKCPLGETRNKFVFGEGNPNAKVMVVGEGPGADEDAQGRPFVGRAGKLLDKILEAVDFKREEVFIGNVVKCRPPGNRTPVQSEMAECLPYLNKQIELIKPKLILCLGKTAALGLLNKKDSLGKMRQQVFEYQGAKVLVTYHPAALLRNPQWKRGTWEDVQLLRKLYEELEENEN